MEPTVEITVNGKKERVPQGLTLGSLLELKNISPNVVACELNLKIIKRALLAETPIHDRDEIEIIQMVGGG